MFWAERGAGRGLFRAALDGSAPTQIVVVACITGVAVDADNCRVYWTAIGKGGAVDGVLESAAFDGSGRQTVLTNLDNPQDVALYAAP